MVTNKQQDLVFKALADSTRREIVKLVADSPAPVHEIANHFQISRPAISKHLNILKKSGLVRASTSGRETIYYIKTSTLKEIENWLNEIWNTKLTALKDLIEENTNE